eukprot:6191654-Pleurochrysis_carterae.AAC.1
MIQTVKWRELARARGLSAPAGRLLWGARRAVAAMRARGNQKLGERTAERFARMHVTRKQNGKLCMRALNSGAWLRFYKLYFANSSGKLIGLEIDIDNNIEYYFSSNDVRSYNGKWGKRNDHTDKLWQPQSGSPTGVYSDIRSWRNIWDIPRAPIRCLAAQAVTRLSCGAIASDTVERPSVCAARGRSVGERVRVQ